MITVGEIIKKYLVDNGYDGLCSDSCGCGLDDLFACDTCDWDCKPAYKFKTDCDKCEIKCEAAFDMGENFCYSTEKRT